jgi:hypothetical protein
MKPKILAIKKSTKRKFGLEPSVDYQKNKTCEKKVHGNVAWTFQYNQKQNVSPQWRSPESPTMKSTNIKIQGQNNTDISIINLIFQKINKAFHLQHLEGLQQCIYWEISHF